MSPALCRWILYTEPPGKSVVGKTWKKKKKIIGSFTEASQALLEPAAKSLQSCPTLCDPIDVSPPGFSIHGIFQARVLEWGAIAFLFVYK